MRDPCPGRITVEGISVRWYSIDPGHTGDRRGGTPLVHTPL